MESIVVTFWLLAHLLVGAGVYMADLKWGIPVRRFCLNLVSAQPRDIQEGFIVGRPRRVWFSWSLLLAYGIGLLVVLSGGASWFFQIVLSALEAVACFAGMHLGPAAGYTLEAVGGGLDKMDRLEATIKEQGPGLVAAAIEKGKEAASTVKEATAEVLDAITQDRSGPPLPTEEELRQEKIDRMDELLGKKPPRARQRDE